MVSIGCKVFLHCLLCLGFAVRVFCGRGGDVGGRGVVSDAGASESKT